MLIFNSFIQNSNKIIDSHGMLMKHEGGGGGGFFLSNLNQRGGIKERIKKKFLLPVWVRYT